MTSFDLGISNGPFPRGADLPNAGLSMGSAFPTFPALGPMSASPFSTSLPMTDLKSVSTGPGMASQGTISYNVACDYSPVHPLVCKYACWPMEVIFQVETGIVRSEDFADRPELRKKKSVVRIRPSTVPVANQYLSSLEGRTVFGKQDSALELMQLLVWYGGCTTAAPSAKARVVDTAAPLADLFRTYDIFDVMSDGPAEAGDDCYFMFRKHLHEPDVTMGLTDDEKKHKHKWQITPMRTRKGRLPDISMYQPESFTGALVYVGRVREVDCSHVKLPRNELLVLLNKILFPKNDLEDYRSELAKLPHITITLCRG